MMNNMMMYKMMMNMTMMMMTTMICVRMTMTMTKMLTCRYSFDRSGQPMYFYPQSGSQFVAEGFIIGALNVGCAIGVVLMAAAPSLTGETNQAIMLLVGVLSFLFCYRQVRSFYIMKNQWYGMVM